MTVQKARKQLDEYALRWFAFIFVIASLIVLRYGYIQIVANDT